MRSIRRLAGLAFAALILNGCTGGTPVSTSASVAPSGAPPAAAAYRLYVADGSTAAFRLIDARSGQVVRDLPMGAPAPDWSRLYVISQEGGRPALAAIDTRTGTIAWRMSIEAGFQLPPANVRGDLGGLSPNGRWLVLERRAGGTSDFLIVDSAMATGARQVTLAGDFTFDAINDDASNLYLIESLAASQPGHYRVRLYDLRAGALDPRIVIDKREYLSASMAGTRIAGLFAPDGRWQYSLYVRASGTAFIHALDLTQNLAWCIDLPGKRADLATERQWGLAVRPDGQEVYASNPALGLVAEIGQANGPMDVNRSASFDPVPGRLLFGAATLSRDGRTLFASDGQGLLAFDTSDLSLRARYLSATTVGTLVPSPDGAWLYASSGSTILQVDPATGRASAILTAPSPLTLYGVDRP
ncbi:MAG TPA: hypothetical protein VET65_08270 [Candidatus Limnocylindrales bacterium]|nr:hypothetical protein [Candidatus Limnocylindrales bacterium]